MTETHTKHIEVRMEALAEKLDKQDRKLDTLAELITSVALQQQTLNHHNDQICEMKDRIQKMIEKDYAHHSIRLKAPETPEEVAAFSVVLKKVFALLLPALTGGGAGLAISTIEIYLR